MNIVTTPLPGVMIAETTPISDHRGSFARFYCERELAPIIGERRIVQINHSRTEALGAVRGMHYQRPPKAEMKLVRCIRGRVWDVALDLRRNSPTFLGWHAVELSNENGRMMAIPEGCAHGFQVLEADSELLYLHTEYYDGAAEGGVRFDDPAVAITWPFPAVDLSDRDRRHPLLDSGFAGIAL